MFKFLRKEQIISVLFLANCVFIIIRRFVVKFSVTHFKFLVNNVLASPPKVTDWIAYSRQAGVIFMLALVG